MQISSRETAVSLRIQKLGFGLSALRLQMTIKEGKNVGLHFKLLIIPN